MTICIPCFPSDGAIGHVYIYTYTRYTHILRAHSNDPMREVLFQAGTNHPRVEHLRRVGKPKANWLYETYVDAFRAIDASNVFDPQNADNLQQRLSPFNNVRNYVLHHLQQAVAHDASHRRICHRISHRIPSSFWLSASLSFNYNLVKHP